MKRLLGLLLAFISLCAFAHATTPDSVNILDYGAIAGNSSQYAVNQAAIQNALATGYPVYCPAGSKFYTQEITVPSNATLLFGQCTLVAAGTYSAPPAAVIYNTASSSFQLRDVIVSVNLSTYPNLDGIDFAYGTNFRLSGVTSSGYIAISDYESTGTIIEKSVVTNFGSVGISSAVGYNTLITENSVTTSESSTNHCIQVGSGGSTTASAEATVSKNFVENCGKFGISIVGSSGTGEAQAHSIVVSNNRTLNTVLEGINLENVALFTVTGNEVEWNNGSSTDFGLSVWGNPNTSPQEVGEIGTISGNSIFNSCKTGIALANIVQSVNVSGNNIYNANYCNGSDNFHIAGILFYGGSNLYNTAYDNNIIDPSAHLTWRMMEYNDGSGAPNYNSFSMTGGTNNGGWIKVIGTTSSIGNPCSYHLGAGTC
jgi:hypothetical protein